MDEGIIPEERYSHMDDKDQERYKKRTKADEKREERAHKKLIKGYKEPVKKAAAVKPRKEVVQAPEEVLGEAEMMLVRVGQSGWDRLTWAIGVHARGSASMSLARTQTQRAERKGDLVGDILGLIHSRPARAASSSMETDIKPNLDTTLTSSQDISPATPKNPFAFARKGTARGVTSLPIPTLTPAPSSSPDLLSSFDGSQGKKRRFGGVDASQGEVKRRGMKMFTRS
jgi:hypothetical protein